MVKKPTAANTEKQPESNEGSKVQASAEIALAWSKIITKASQNPRYAQSAFADLSTAFQEIGIEDISMINLETDLIPSFSNAQRMVSGALNLLEGTGPAIGEMPQYSGFGTIGAANLKTKTNQEEQTGESKMYTYDSQAGATLQGGCTGSFGTVGSLGTVGGTAGTAATVGTLGSAGAMDRPVPCEASMQTMATARPTMHTHATQFTQPTVFTSGTQFTQACKPTTATQFTQPTQPTVLTQPTVFTSGTQFTQACKPTVATLGSQQCVGSMVSQPLISSTRLSGAGYATPLDGGCWGSAGTIGSAGSFGGCAGTVGTGACYGCGGDSAYTPEPCAATQATQPTQACIKPFPPTIMTQACIKPTLQTTFTQPVSTMATKPTTASLLSQPAPISAPMFRGDGDPLSGACNGTFGTVGCIGSVGGCAGSAGTVGTLGSAGITAELSASPFERTSTMTMPTQACSATTQTQASWAAKPRALTSTRLSGATMGSFATYCGCVADTGVQTDDALSGACWGSAGTIGSAGTFGGCAGSVGTAACYGSAGGKDLMVNRGPISAVNMDSISQLRMQPLGGGASYGSYACA